MVGLNGEPLLANTLDAPTKNVQTVVIIIVLLFINPPFNGSGLIVGGPAMFEDKKRLQPYEKHIRIYV
jgi:hypothetical protein